MEALKKLPAKSHHAILNLEAEKNTLTQLVETLCTKIGAEFPKHWPTFKLEINFEEAEPCLFSPLNPDLHNGTTTAQGLAHMLGALSQTKILAKQPAHPKMLKRLNAMHVPEQFDQNVLVSITGEKEHIFSSHLSVNDAKAQGLANFILQSFRQMNPCRKSKVLKTAYISGQKFSQKAFNRYDRTSWSLEQHFFCLVRSTKLLPKQILKDVDNISRCANIDLAYSRVYRLLVNTDTQKEKELFSVYGPRGLEYARTSPTFMAHDAWHAKALALMSFFPKTTWYNFEQMVQSIDKWTVYHLTPSPTVSLNIS